MLHQTGAIVGYYTFPRKVFRLANSPRNFQNTPNFPRLCWARWRSVVSEVGKRCAGLLVMDALRRSWKNTAEVASNRRCHGAYDEGRAGIL